jgi:hypothetical protein
MIQIIWKNYSLSIVLFSLFFSSLLGQYIFQWIEFTHEQQAHNQAIQVSEFFPMFLRAVFENWQSEFLQLFTFVLLTAFLIHKGSHESKDSDEEIKAMLGRIEDKLEGKKKH